MKRETDEFAEATEFDRGDVNAQARGIAALVGMLEQSDTITEEYVQRRKLPGGGTAELLRFKLQPLTPRETDRCRRQSMRLRDKKREPEFDYLEYLGRSIYLATAPGESGIKIWDTQELKEYAARRLGDPLPSGHQVVNASLNMGELSEVSEIIQRLSGVAELDEWGADEDEQAKN